MDEAFVTAALGILFGFALQKVGLTNYSTVINQFRLKDWTMMKFMCTAISTGSVIYLLFQPETVLMTETVPPVSIAGNLLGGAIFGAGMAVAGTCPGTLIAGIGQGNMDYLTAGLAGFITGGLFFGFLFKFFLGIIMTGFLGEMTLSTITGINPWLFTDLICGFVITFYILTSWKTKEDEV